MLQTLIPGSTLNDTGNLLSAQLARLEIAEHAIGSDVPQPVCLGVRQLGVTPRALGTMGTGVEGAERDVAETERE